MALHGNKTSPEFCLPACAWKDYPVPAQIPVRLRNARMHTQLLSATRKNFLVSELWSTSSQRDWAAQVEIKYETIWRFWRSCYGESDLISYCVGSTRQHFDHCGGLQGQPLWAAAMCPPHIVPASSNGHRAQLSPAVKVVASLGKLI